MRKLTFNNSFSRLGEDFFTHLQPTGLPNPKLVSINTEASDLLGLKQSELTQDWFLQWSSGNQTLSDSDPLAMVYSGHQFGGYSPQLGDGRGLLLGEVEGPKGKWDIHLKGAGSTPYSRSGDGRAVLRSSIREYLCSEAMHGLGISSTRRLSITIGEEPVYREQVEPAAMLIRLARSHIRFGSFEYFHHTRQPDRVKQLADYVINQHLPEQPEVEVSNSQVLNPQTPNNKNQYLEMFRYTVHSTAKLIAQWQAVGFAHGVMNTDNMSIIGETMDYGPFGFLDAYDPEFICNHSDTGGRYAFKRQPMIGLWNCNALAQALTSLLSVDELKTVLGEYEPLFFETLLELQRQKLGLLEHHPDDQALIDSLLNTLAENQVDYTIFFRNLCTFDEHSFDENNPDKNNHQEQSNHTSLRNLFLNRDAFDAWAETYSERLAEENRTTTDRQVAMLKVNPKYVFRNYMAEIAIRKAEDEQDYSEIDRLLELLQSPFDEHPDFEEYAKHPPVWSQKLSVSCSS